MIPFAVVVVLWLIFTAPFWLKGQLPFPTKYLVSFFPPWSATYAMPVKNAAMPDVITQIYPWKHLTIATWKIAQVPLWNPYSFAGTFHAGNYQSAVFSPTNLLYALLPAPAAWSIVVLLQPLVAGWGMYLLLRTLGRSRPARIVGSVAFMFCGFMTTWMAYGTLGYAAVWLPWLFAVILQYERHRSFFWGACLSIGMALSFLSGHFQISLYVTSATFIFITSRMFWNRSIRQGLVLSGFMVLGIIIALPQLWLTLDAYLQSVRSSSFVKGEIIPWSYLITMIAPDFYGNPVTRNDWFGHYAEWATYTGVIPWILALLPVFFRRTKDIAVFLFLVIGGLLLALPTPFSDLLFALKIPVLSTSAASRIVVLVSFGLSVLAAYGFDIVREAAWTERKKYLRYMCGIAILWAVVWGILLFNPIWEADTLSIAKRNFILPTVFMVVAFGSIGMVTQFRSWVRRIGLLVLVAVTVFEMYRYVTKWLPFEPPEFFYPNTPVIEYLTKHIGNDRVFGNIGGEVGVRFGIPLIEGYDAMYQGRYGEFIRSAGTGTFEQSGRSVVTLEKHGLYAEQVLQMLGVRYVVHRKSDGRSPWAYPVWLFDHYRQVYADDHYEIYENTKALPRTYLVPAVQIKQTNEEILAAMYVRDFNIRQSVILETVPQLDPQAGNGSAQIVSYTPNQVRITVQSDGPQMLVLSDVYEKGWQATVNSVTVPVYRANYAFRAIAVPAGNSTVTFEYKPDGIRYGIPIALIAVGVLVLGIWKERYENRHI